MSNSWHTFLPGRMTWCNSVLYFVIPEPKLVIQMKGVASAPPPQENRQLLGKTVTRASPRMHS
jgi:hypothetical protein